MEERVCEGPEDWHMNEGSNVDSQVRGRGAAASSTWSRVVKMKTVIIRKADSQPRRLKRKAGGLERKHMKSCRKEKLKQHRRRLRGQRSLGSASVLWLTFDGEQVCREVTGLVIR